ncbi:Glycosyl transferase group 1 [Candidatus Sulfotelmatomonas gaucii]|uniref:Glycosyl transferase group 1 n=1 Tax=Candidatus Sulfuritelmatomonas gaucii TaxID=2043161 RepID=A0A2N9LX16_9BACT|nr:Glycosyl transferase group 1 [Candidatus Sulfotelmatomonas gaucii]
MKILIAAASFATSISGLQRHAFNLARCLLLRAEVSNLHLVVAPWQCDLAQTAGLPTDVRLSIHIADISRSSLSRNLWYYRLLPQLARRLQVDLVHLSYPMPLNAAAFHCPTVVSLHDLYPYEIPMNFGFPKFILNRIVLQQCLRSADAIACVSGATRIRLKQYALAAVWQKAVGIYNCVEPTLVLSSVCPLPGLRDEPFLLCVAQHRRNKNIPTLIRTFDRLLHSGEIEPNSRLVIVGMAGPESGRIRRLVASRGLGGSVDLLEDLSEHELQWCYRHCAALVAPSLTEGFGLPVAEGLLAGCRIVCSDIAAHREIGDGHCQFVSLREYAVEALAGAIVDALRKPKGEPIALPQLSAHVLARQYMSLYRRLVLSESHAEDARAAGSLKIGTSESRSI